MISMHTHLTRVLTSIQRGGRCTCLEFTLLPAITSNERRHYLYRWVQSSCAEDDIIDGNEDKLDDVPDEADH